MLLIKSESPQIVLDRNHIQIVCPRLVTRQLSKRALQYSTRLSAVKKIGANSQEKPDIALSDAKLYAASTCDTAATLWCLAVGPMHMQKIAGLRWLSIPGLRKIYMLQY